MNRNEPTNPIEIGMVTARELCLFTGYIREYQRRVGVSRIVYTLLFEYATIYYRTLRGGPSGSFAKDIIWAYI